MTPVASAADESLALHGLTVSTATQGLNTKPTRHGPLTPAALSRPLERRIDVS